MNKTRLLSPFAAVLFLVSVFAWAPTAGAYTNYNDEGNGCVRCHPSFVNRGDLHDLHVSQMTSKCTLCHVQVGDDPMTNDSGDAAGEGCRGCHGVDPMPGTPNDFWGAGLRLHHANNFITDCLECHPSDPTPPAENVLPLYYMRGDVNVKDPCNADGTEDWDADNVGLDNDGDNDYDGDDSDCAMGTTTTTLAPTTTTTMPVTTTTTMPGTTTTTMQGTTTTTMPGTTTTTMQGTTTTTMPGTTTTTMQGTTTTMQGTTTTTMPGGQGCADPIALIYGEPVSPKARVVTATDALFVLNAAVGNESCMDCVCDTNGSGSVTATDSLITLNFAVGVQVELMCPPCT